MTDELLKQISDAVREDEQRKEDQAGVSIVIGNVGSGTTVIIGNGNNVNQGKEEQGDGGGQQRRQASDRAMHQEVRQLRQQVRSLKHLVTRLYAGRKRVLKRPTTSRRSCRTSSVQTIRVNENVANHASRAASPPRSPHRPASRATPRPNSHRPAPTRINPDISYLMSAHSRIIRASKSTIA